MLTRNILLFALLFLSQASFSKLPQLSENSKISVLTCAAGTELYSAFGHTAFRVQDSVLGIDVVYNYGTFDPDKPNFYINFALGKMQYSLSRKSFERFLFDYELEKRWVKEQVLDLDSNEKNTLFAFFEKNYLPENREYAYDPLFNNCSSMIADILENQYGDAIVFNDSHLEEPFTFRQLINQHLDWNSWGAFGINLCYGAVVDRKANLREHMFLPYYTMSQLQNTTKGEKPLVFKERKILGYPEKKAKSYFPITPLFWVLLIAIFVLTITYIDFKHQSQNKWLDFILFFVTGLIGLLLVFLWFVTVHSGTPNNLNVLWVLPMNMVVAFYLLKDKKPSWLHKYLWISLCLMMITLLLWIFRVQVFSPLVLILIIALAIRYLFLIYQSVKLQS